MEYMTTLMVRSTPSRCAFKIFSFNRAQDLLCPLTTFIDKQLYGAYNNIDDSIKVE